jgi:hypothetical protein
MICSMPRRRAVTTSPPWLSFPSSADQSYRGGMSSNYRVRFAQAARLLFWAALVFATVLALLPKPPTVAGELGDKYQHMLAFGTLTILACAGHPRAELLRIGERLTSLAPSSRSRSPFLRCTVIAILRTGWPTRSWS